MSLPELSEQDRNMYILTGYEIIEHECGLRSWWLNGLYHREDGPAVEFADGHREWYLNGELHRADGPALESPESGYRAWYLNNTKMTEEEFNSRTKD